MINLIFSKFTKETLALLIGNTTAAVFGIIFTIFAARILGPDNWGIAAAVISLITILVAFGDLGLTSSIFRFLPKNKNVISIFFTIRFITAVVLSLVLVILSGFLSETVFKVNDPMLLAIAALALFGSLSLDFQIALMESKRNFKIAAIFISLTNVLRVILLIFLPVLLAFALSPLLIFIIYIIYRKGWNLITYDSLLILKQEGKKTIKDIIPFSSWMGLNRVVGALSSRVDVLLILQLSTTYQTGIFAASKQLAMGIPIVLGSFATVLAPRFSTLEGKPLIKFFINTIFFSAIISLGILILAFFSGSIISLFGEKYVGSEDILFWLLIAFIPAALATPAVNFLIYSLNKPKVIALTSFVQMPLVIFLNIHLIPSFGIFASAIILGLLNLSTMFISYFFAWYFWSKK